MKKNDLGSVKQRLLKQLTARWWYFFDGERWYNAQGEALSGTPSGFIVVVVARQCYRSKRSSWPIKSQRELQQVLQQKQPGELHWIHPFSNNQRAVDSVSIAERYESALHNARFVLPEHWLVNRIQPDEQFWQVQTPAGTWYSDKSHQQYGHVIKAGVISNLQTAKAALGVSDDSRTETLDWHDYLARLKQAMAKLSPSQYAAAHRAARKQRQSIAWKPLGITGGALLGAYALLSTLYLHYLEYSRTQQLQSFGTEVDQRLLERSELQQAVSRIRALSQLPMDSGKLASNWNVIGFLYMNEVTISRLSSQSGVIEITGSAPSATGIADKLTQLEQVNSVTFASPVRRSRDGEVFTLTVEMGGNSG